MKSVTVAAFNSRDEAEPLAQWLEALGIAAEVRSDLRVDQLLDYRRPGAGFRIEVAREDFEPALRLIYEWNSGGGSTPGPGLPPEVAPASLRNRDLPWLEDAET